MRQKFISIFQSDAAPGLLLMGMAALALILANSPLGPVYFSAANGVHFAVNDVLMAVFFLVVGLEIKREFMVGSLASRAAALQPVFAAIGGMAVPAFIFLVVTKDHPQFARGWAVPTATDIAFALGVLTLAGSRVPVHIKALLTAIAIMDDLGAILIIALFYTDTLYPIYAALAVFGLFGLCVLNRKHNPNSLPYLVCGGVVWFAFLKAGIHPTLAGVVTALCIPMSIIPALEKKLHGFVVFFVLPVFALFNAGLSFDGMSVQSLGDPLCLGVLAGLWVGKPLGIIGGLAFGHKTGLARVEQWRGLVGMAFLCGIGFTMALFIGDLAFVDPAARSDVKLGVLSASLLSAVIGWGLCRHGLRHKRQG